MDLLTSTESDNLISSVITSNETNYEQQQQNNSVAGCVIFEADVKPDMSILCHEPSNILHGKKCVLIYRIIILEFVLKQLLSFLNTYVN